MNAESCTDQTRMPGDGHADGAINANDQSCSGAGGQQQVF